MAIIHPRVRRHIRSSLTRAHAQRQAFWKYDPVLQLAEYCHELRPRIDFPQPLTFTAERIARARGLYGSRGIVGVCDAVFGEQILARLSSETGSVSLFYRFFEHGGIFRPCVTARNVVT